MKMIDDAEITPLVDSKCATTADTREGVVCVPVLLESLAYS
jgi:hypothetical protein